MLHSHFAMMLMPFLYYESRPKTHQFFMDTQTSCSLFPFLKNQLEFYCLLTRCVRETRILVFWIDVTPPTGVPFAFCMLCLFLKIYPGIIFVLPLHYASKYLDKKQYYNYIHLSLM